ncbi:MAG TPA: pantoate--beta-alanine ligase [Verrucomicrobia bacterium]|nr:pantoate--beta-alanine ligase [Verrucomicrobiota bacterium]
MKIISTAREMQQAALALRAQGKRIGLVPTMGNLHEGHLSLVRIARKHSDAVVVSIFVNPTQFGPNEDFAAYPRTFEADRARCEQEGVDLVFHPAVSEMYPDGAGVRVTETSLSRTLCGAARPGHFDGVCTIVAKLFNVALPHLAVFGEKDAQQLRVIRRMVRDLRFPVEIVPGPTVREPDGLALSSRNQYLTPDQRPQAVCLRRALDEAERRFAAGERDPATLIAAMRAIIAQAPAAKVDYVDIVDDDTLQPLSGPIVRPALAALAVWVGQPRLIDNTVLRP